MTSTTNNTSRQTLLAFDFDHTILDANTDLYIVKMVPGGELPAKIRALYTKNNWTYYMGEVFKYLHSLGYGPKQMNEFMCSMTFAPGMKDLIGYLHKLNMDQIIISDSNSVFIDTILKKANLRDCFVNVFTNPAKFLDDGRLTLDFYHHQDWCDMSTVNMCKGHILTEFIEEQKTKGIEYNRIVYVGDGSNDICPATRLNEDDILFMRRGYRLHKLLQKPEEKVKVKAKCIDYEDANEIIEKLKPHLE